MTLEFRVTSDAWREEARPAVVLVHGIGMSHRYLSRLQDTLADDGPVFSMDLPGYGGLPKPDRDIGVEEMASGIGDVLASLGAGPVVLVGHSMGSQWVAETALQRPDLVRHVVMIGPVADCERRTLVAQMRALAVDTIRETPLVNSIVFTDYLRCGLPWYLAQVRHMLAYPLEERVAHLAVPLTIIRGGRDPIAGLEWCRLLRRRALGSALVNVPGHAHVVQHSAPHAVASAIRAHEQR